MLTNFTAAPHRMMFFGGALQSIAVMLWWLIELVMRYGSVGHPLVWTIVPSAAHIYLMIYSLFPFFMFGFLMTVFPRWMNGREITAHYYVTAFALLMLGAASFYIGLLSNIVILSLAVICTLAGWGVALYALLRVLLYTQHPDKQHPKIIFVALCLGWCGLVAYLIWLIDGNSLWLKIAIQGGLWLFLLPVFASVAHRMIPFFTCSALQNNAVKRPYWPWWVILTTSMVHGLLQLADLPNWVWMSDAMLTIAALYLSYCWGLIRSLHIPLLGILHIGFAWMGIAMLLFTIQGFLLFLSDGETFILGLAPLHALTIGCFATLLIGMATRVTLGHAGLPMNVDRPIIWMFAGMQLAALLRVMADILPMQAGHSLYVASAAVWLACFLPWVLRYFPVYWRPRIDGREG